MQASTFFREHTNHSYEHLPRNRRSLHCKPGRLPSEQPAFEVVPVAEVWLALQARTFAQ